MNKTLYALAKNGLTLHSTDSGFSQNIYRINSVSIKIYFYIFPPKCYNMTLQLHFANGCRKQTPHDMIFFEINQLGILKCISICLLFLFIQVKGYPPLRTNFFCIFALYETKNNDFTLGILSIHEIILAWKIHISIPFSS